MAVPMIGSGESFTPAKMSRLIVDACGRFAVQQSAPRNIKEIALVAYSDADYEEFVEAITEAFKMSANQRPQSAMAQSAPIFTGTKRTVRPIFLIQKDGNPTP